MKLKVNLKVHLSPEVTLTELDLRCIYFTICSLVKKKKKG